jgi:hypothetical protein
MGMSGGAVTWIVFFSVLVGGGLTGGVITYFVRRNDAIKKKQETQGVAPQVMA